MKMNVLVFTFGVLIIYSSWDKSEGILRLLLEYGEMDLSEIIRTRGTSRPLKQEPLLLLYLWQQMLRSVKVQAAKCIIQWLHMYVYTCTCILNGYNCVHSHIVLIRYILYC